MDVSTEDRCVVNGIPYINVRTNNEMFTLPQSSIGVDPNAYFIKPIEDDENTCSNTIKTKSRFYARAGGILVMAKPCGTIVAISEIFGGESVSHVAEVIEHYLQSIDSDTKCFVYDDACHLCKHVKCRCVYPKLSEIEMKIDRFHFVNHTDAWCQKHMNPATSKYLSKVNTEVMEQIFSWVKGFVLALRYMKSCNYNFFMLDMIERHNMALSY